MGGQCYVTVLSDGKGRGNDYVGKIGSIFTDLLFGTRIGFPLSY